MRSQEAFNLLQSAREIKVAIAADGDRVGGLLNEQHPLPAAEGESTLDYRQHMRQMSNRLDKVVDDVVTGEDEHSDQLIRVSRSQDERDEVARRGYDKLSSTRQGLDSLYRCGGFELAFISGETPRAPKKLCEQLGQTVKLLQRPVVERRQPKIKGFSIDLGEVASDLESVRRQLRDALDQVAAARKKAEGTLLVKRQALDALRLTVTWVGRTTEGLFHLAGEDELARRVRTSTRRPPRPSEKTATDGDKIDETVGQAAGQAVHDLAELTGSSEADGRRTEDGRVPPDFRSVVLPQEMGAMSDRSIPLVSRNGCDTLGADDLLPIHFPFVSRNGCDV